MDAKVTPKIYAKIKTLSEQGKSEREIAAMVGVSKGRVNWAKQQMYASGELRKWKKIPGVKRAPNDRYLAALRRVHPERDPLFIAPTDTRSARRPVGAGNKQTGAETREKETT